MLLTRTYSFYSVFKGELSYFIFLLMQFQKLHPESSKTQLLYKTARQQIKKCRKHLDLSQGKAHNNQQ